MCQGSIAEGGRTFHVEYRDWVTVEEPPTSEASPPPGGGAAAPQQAGGRKRDQPEDGGQPGEKVLKIRISGFREKNQQLWARTEMNILALRICAGGGVVAAAVARHHEGLPAGAAAAAAAAGTRRRGSAPASGRRRRGVFRVKYPSQHPPLQRLCNCREACRVCRA